MRLNVERLEDRCCAAVAVGAMGDSLTAHFGDDWVDLLNRLRPGAYAIHDVAVPGATSETVLSGGQPAAAAAGAPPVITLLIGGNDLNADKQALAKGNYAGLPAIVANIETALQQAAADDPGVRLILGAVPDISKTPLVRKYFNGNAGELANVCRAAQLVDQQLSSYCAANHIAFLDDFSFEQDVAASGLVLGGTPVPRSDLFLSDGFHPTWPASGLYANMVTEAIAAFGLEAASPLSDQELLATMSLAPKDPGPTYFDLSPYEQFNP
jgi:lysophospholipase L1-like esterase